MGGVKELIFKLHEVLNMIKDFSTGYGSDTLSDGKMLIIHKGKVYAVKIVEFENPSDDMFKNIKNLKYQI